MQLSNIPRIDAMPSGTIAIDSTGVIVARAPDVINIQNYAYKAEVASIAAGATATDVVNVEADADFIWCKTTMAAYIANASVTHSSRVVPLVKVQIRETGAGREFFRDPLPMDTFAGTGDSPAILPIAQKLIKSSTLQFAFENFNASATYVNLFLVLQGYKVYTNA
jgi:hypothetical protein